MERVDGYRIPILTYHSIDDDGSVVSTSPETFRRQMQYLRAHSFRTISLSKIATLLHEKRPFPANTIGLAFDDGYQNTFSEAFPILQECAFGATVFLVTGYCGRYNDWPGNSPSLKRSPLLSWSEVKEMKKWGIEFGSHTLTHPDLTRTGIELAAREVLQSKEELEDRLGSPAALFAYPYGQYNRRIRELVQNHFHGACSTKLGNVVAGADPYMIRRIDSWFVSNQRLFNEMTTKLFAVYLQFRQVLRDIRSLV